jgi:hypothetical protein
MVDTGCCIAKAIEALEESGTCLESIWPFDISQVNARPSDEAYNAAQNNTINEAMKVEVNLDEMKSCLAQGYPFVFGLKLFKSFSQEAKKGVVTAPKPTEEARETHSRSDFILIKKIITIYDIL